MRIGQVVASATVVHGVELFPLTRVSQPFESVAMTSPDAVMAALVAPEVTPPSPVVPSAVFH